MDSLTVVTRYLQRRAHQDVAGILALLTTDVVLCVNGISYEGLVAVRKYLTENYLPTISQDDPILLPDGRVGWNMKVRKFWLPVSVYTVFTVRDSEISRIDVTASLF